MESNERITVLMPFWNREQFIGPAIKSIEDQTNDNFDMIFYDDGSTDQSRKIVESFIERNPSWKLIVGKENKGVGYARNVLLEAIETPLACWMDSDDISQPDRLKFLVRELQEEDIVFSYMRFFWELPGRVVRHPYKIDISKYTSRDGLANNMCFASTGFRSYLGVDHKFPHKRRREDIEWLWNMIDAGVPFSIIKKDLYWVRRHDGRITVQLGDDKKYKEINSR